jgi:hypothetical protein
MAGLDRDAALERPTYRTPILSAVASNLAPNSRSAHPRVRDYATSLSRSPIRRRHCRCMQGGPSSGWLPRIVVRNSGFAPNGSSGSFSRRHPDCPVVRKSVRENDTFSRLADLGAPDRKTRAAHSASPLYRPRSSRRTYGPPMSGSKKSLPASCSATRAPPSDREKHCPTCDHDFTNGKKNSRRAMKNIVLDYDHRSIQIPIIRSDGR